MKQIPVKFKNLRDAKNLVQIAQLYDFDVKLISGNYIVNAKSILGIFTLPQFDNVKFQIDTDDIDDIENIKKQLKKLDLLDE